MEKGIAKEKGGKKESTHRGLITLHNYFGHLQVRASESNRSDQHSENDPTAFGIKQTKEMLEAELALATRAHGEVEVRWGRGRAEGGSGELQVAEKPSRLQIPTCHPKILTPCKPRIPGRAGGMQSSREQRERSAQGIPKSHGPHCSIASR